ncbi:unnamed protein product, partial [Scytosiphon promiscuus]
MDDIKYLDYREVFTSTTLHVPAQEVYLMRFDESFIIRCDFSVDDNNRGKLHMNNLHDMSCTRTQLSASHTYYVFDMDGIYIHIAPSSTLIFCSNLFRLRPNTSKTSDDCLEEMWSRLDRKAMAHTQAINGSSYFQVASDSSRHSSATSRAMASSSTTVHNVW